MSKILGIDPSTLGRIENNRGKRINKAIREKLKTFFYSPIGAIKAERRSIAKCRHSVL
jgi:hypothetical protein